MPESFVARPPAVHTKIYTVGISVSAAGTSPGAPWQDASVPIQRRVLALVSNMTTEEKIGQLSSNSPAIEHLGISAFNWWTGQNCLLLSCTPRPTWAKQSAVNTMHASSQRVSCLHAQHSCQVPHLQVALFTRYLCGSRRNLSGYGMNNHNVTPPQSL